MSDESVTLLGYLDHDGNLRLNGPIKLRPGVVEVAIKPYVNNRPGETLVEFLRRTRAELEASGHGFRTKEEIDAEIEEMRSEWDERLDEIYRQIEEQRFLDNDDGSSPN